MHSRYDDIVERIAERPLWWLDGVPRYGPFHPKPFWGREVALVHTECQECRTRYDVAVQPRWPVCISLRDALAYANSFDVGDPPNACNVLRARCAAGPTMTSLEVRILEFWVRDGTFDPWRRDKSMERPLVDVNWDDNEEPDAVWYRIFHSDRRDEWQRARLSGDVAAMRTILQAFDCERPAEVAHMLDVERRHVLFRDEIAALRRERLGGN